MKKIKSVLMMVVTALLLSGCVNTIDSLPEIEFTVTFETYEGTDVSSVVVVKGQSINVDEYTSTQDNSDFLGWTLLNEMEVLALSSEISYNTGEFTPEDDITFYAVWGNGK